MWQKVAKLSDASGTAYVLDLVSQTSLTPAEVHRPEWRHGLTILKPANLAPSTALRFISGGSNKPGNPPKPSRELIDLAKATRSAVAEIRMVPNQPLPFHGDGQPRTGDERWPVRLPMTQSAGRAMDAVTAFLASDAGGKATVDTFVVSGGPKRGWIAWTTAAVDRRVVAPAPFVIDVLNPALSLDHHVRVYGFYGPTVGDYVRHHRREWSGTPAAKALSATEDPISYRDQLRSRPEEHGRRPNTQRVASRDSPPHAAPADLMATLRRRHARHHRENPPHLRPPLTDDESRCPRLPPRNARPPFGTSTPSKPTAAPTPRKSPPIAAGWTASFIELTFDGDATAPLKLTTDIAVTPDTDITVNETRSAPPDTGA